MAALERALHEADERFGPVDDGLIQRAEAQLAAPVRPSKHKRRRATAGVKHCSLGWSPPSTFARRM